MTTYFIQTFYVDASQFNGAAAVYAAQASLFLKSVPTITNNVSGIVNPGLTIFLCNVAQNGTPILQGMTQLTRGGASTIACSSDGSIEQGFMQINPIRLQTNQHYGLVLGVEDPGYVLFTNVQGDPLIGTNTPSPGAHFDGNFFISTGSTISALNNTTLKFKLYFSKFIANTASLSIVNYDYEFLTATTLNNILYTSEYVYQDFGNTAANVTFYCNGSIFANSSIQNLVGTNTSFTTLFNSGDRFVLTDGTSQNTCLLTVAYVTNNTNMTVIGYPSFSNTTAKFKKTASGVGYFYDPLSNKLVLTSSDATSTKYFSNNGILTLYVTVGGTAYTNGDLVKVSGGTVNAQAVVTTNSTGGIIALNISNTGAGSPSVVSISNSSGGATTGSGATIVANQFGSYLIGLYSGAKSLLNHVDDWPVHQFDSEIMYATTAATSIKVTHNFAYNNGGTSYYVTGSNANTLVNPGMNDLSYNAIIMSKTNERLYSTNLANNKSVSFTANLVANLPNTNLYESPQMYLGKMDMFVYNNMINNSIVNEHLPQGGNCTSRHVTATVNLANNAEDLRVYLDIWKPAQTNVYVYAKIYNSTDSDPFNAKYWTQLVQIDPASNVVSSSSDDTDIIEFTYGFPQFPPSANTARGMISISGTTVTGTNTFFSQDVSANQAVKIYDPLFPNTTFGIAIVNAVTNNTALTLAQPTGISARSGLVMDVISTQFTAFNNIQNDNVVRYFTSSYNAVDGFSSFALKIAMVSSNSYIAPIISDIRAVGLSA